MRGKSWGHEPKSSGPNPYSGLFPFFSMLKQVCLLRILIPLEEPPHLTADVCKLDACLRDKVEFVV